MVQAIIEDNGAVMPVCAYLTGQYGLQDVYCGVPAALGSYGIREIVEVNLTEEEKQLLRRFEESRRQHAVK